MTFQELKDQSDNFTRYEVFPYVQMSPELASMILTLNTNNRKKTKASQKKYAKHMKSGEWMRSGCTIVISKKGVLQDGQHRLEAVVESGQTVEMIVVVGTDYEAFKVIDTGKNRSVIDLISVMEPGLAGSDRRNTFRICRYIYNYKNGGMGFGNNNKFDNNLELGNFYENLELSDKEYIEMSLGKGEFYSKRSSVKIADIPTYAFTYYILSQINKEKADAFFEGLSSGENISRDNGTGAIFMLRDVLLNIASATKRQHHQAQFNIAYIFKAWNHYIDGTKPKQLSIKGADTFPIPRGSEVTKVVTMEVEAQQTPQEVVNATIEAVKGNKTSKTKSAAY